MYGHGCLTSHWVCEQPRLGPEEIFIDLAGSNQALELLEPSECSELEDFLRHFNPSE
jgi:hypothetical protein